MEIHKDRIGAEEAMEASDSRMRIREASGHRTND